MAHVTASKGTPHELRKHYRAHREILRHCSCAQPRCKRHSRRLRAEFEASLNKDAGRRPEEFRQSDPDPRVRAKAKAVFPLFVAAFLLSLQGKVASLPFPLSRRASETFVTVSGPETAPAGAAAAPLEEIKDEPGERLVVSRPPKGPLDDLAAVAQWVMPVSRPTLRGALRAWSSQPKARPPEGLPRSVSGPPLSSSLEKSRKRTQRTLRA